MLGESPFWGLGAAFRLSLGRCTEQRQSLCHSGYWWDSTSGHLCVPAQQHLPSSHTHCAWGPMSTSSPAAGGNHQPTRSLGISACGLLMVPRAGIAWGSISCLPVAPFGVRARASSQPGSQLGPGTGSGEKGEAAAQPFLCGMAGAADSWDH